MNAALSTGLTALLALFTLLPLSKRKAWWIRGADFPRLQAVALAGALLVWHVFLLKLGQPLAWILIFITLTCLAYQAWWILPNTRLHAKEVQDASRCPQEETICIMSVNVLMPNLHTDKLLDIVRHYAPDVLIAVETNQRWEAALNTLPDYPHSIKCPLDNLYGMHLYSRLPLHDKAVQFLVERDVPSFHAAVELRSGQRVQLHCLHPAPPSPTENEESTERDAELIIVAKAVADSESPVIVAGDLNDVAWSATTRLFRKISGLLDPRVGRGMYNTYHAQHFYLRWPLDHLFHSRHFQVKKLTRLPAFGSDHFPILVELVHVPEAPQRQSGLQADAEDEADARHNAAQGDVHEDDVHQPRA